MALIKKKTRVLFVCTENICRSPMAEGLMRHHLMQNGLAAGIKVSSAGTNTSQPGARPDQRARDVAVAAGIKLDKIRARRVTESDLETHDLILAMDHSHLRSLVRMCPPQHRHKVSLLLSHDPHQSLEEVPDPYFGNREGFVQVFRLVESAVVALIPHLGTLPAR